MNIPRFEESKLRMPERIEEMIKKMETDPRYKEVLEVAMIAKMCLGSSDNNAYLEKIGAEAIGAKHLSDKLGPDGDWKGEGVEVKPFKKSIGVKAVAVINDDTPMKLLKSHKEEKWLVLLCANKTGTQIHYAICAPYQYWENHRYKAIVERLKLCPTNGWHWPDTLPTDKEERLQCMEELVEKHQAKTYVRASPLSLDVLAEIPREEISLWVHPATDKQKLHPIVRNLL